MNSQTATKTDLTAPLIQLGLKATAAGLNDLIARASKSRWSPQLLLEELTRTEIRERAATAASTAAEKLIVDSHDAKADKALVDGAIAGI